MNTKIQELVSLKNKTDADLKKLKIQVSAAKRTAMSTRKFLPPDVLMNMELEVARLQHKSQRLQQVIGRESQLEKTNRNSSRMQCFIDVAKTHLTKEQFQSWMEEANSLSGAANHG